MLAHVLVHLSFLRKLQFIMFQHFCDFGKLKFKLLYFLLILFALLV